MKVSFFDLSRQYKGIRQEIERKTKEILESCQYVEGEAVKNLEKEMETYLGVKHVITCANGTDALRIALQACGVGRGDEVITTAFSFFATAEAVGQLGAVPVFADIVGNGNYNINVEDVRRKITKKTKAILPVHLFGKPVEMEELKEAAEASNIPVIEDACQAIGAEYRGSKAGTLGTMGCFSFYPTKNLGAFGDGGMIVTDDDELAVICRGIKAHAAGERGAEAYRYLYHKEGVLWECPDPGSPCDSKYYNYFIGGNSRLDSIQAGILSVKLKYLDEYNRRRKRIAEIYSEGLQDMPVLLPAGDSADSSSCWHQYVLSCDWKEGVIKYLGDNGIGAGNFYPVPLHLQKAFSELGYAPGSLPVAEREAHRTVCLPMFPELRRDEIDYVIDTVRKYCTAQGGD